MDIILKYFSDFTDKQVAQLKALEGLYKEWNEKINVISRKDIDSLYEKHILHSLSIAAIFSFEDGMQIVDLGCGGGFPGIPLAIFFPDVHFHMVDSIAKKLKVVHTVADAIELKNITVQHSRIEDIQDRRFDFVVSRAVAPLKDLWKWSKPIIRQEAWFDKLTNIGKGQRTIGKEQKARGKGQKGIIEKPSVYAEEHQTFRPGLICLKGGDLTQEIYESHTRPHVISIKDIFDEPYFDEKYLLYVLK